MSQTITPPVETTEPAEDAVRVYGLAAEFDDVTAVTHAARAAREAGYRRFDVCSPFPIHGIDEAIGIRPTILPWIVLASGLTGMASGLVLTMFTMSNWDIAVPGPPGAPPLEPYPFLISGKPFLSLPAFIPVIFELTILLSAFGAVFGMFLLNKLPMLYQPVFNSKLYARATSDRFVLIVDARDRKFDEAETAAFFAERGALDTELINE